jgi:hypothetical protein
VKLLWILAIFVVVVIAVFLPVVELFSKLALGVQDARLYGEARLIVTAANSLNSEGSIATIEVSIPSGRIVVGRGYVEVRTSRGDVRRFEANVDGSLELGKGRHTLLLRYSGSRVEVTLG